jgi:hypothetical protein
LIRNWLMEGKEWVSQFHLRHATNAESRWNTAVLMERRTLHDGFRLESVKIQFVCGIWSRCRCTYYLGEWRCSIVEVASVIGWEWNLGVWCNLQIHPRVNGMGIVWNVAVWINAGENHVRTLRVWDGWGDDSPLETLSLWKMWISRYPSQEWTAIVSTLSRLYNVQT